MYIAIGTKYEQITLSYQIQIDINHAVAGFEAFNKVTNKYTLTDSYKMFGFKIRDALLPCLVSGRRYASLVTVNWSLQVTAWVSSVASHLDLG